MWSKLSEAERRPYDQKAEADKARFKREMEQYSANH